MVALPDRILMSAEEYLIWEPTQEERYEYWDGELVARSGGTRNHNRVCGNFFRLLDDALVDRVCEVYIVDVKVLLESGKKYFYPDVVVTCDERDRNPQLVQFPCLIIEVLSPSTQAAEAGEEVCQVPPIFYSTRICLSTGSATGCGSVSARRTGKMGTV